MEKREAVSLEFRCNVYWITIGNSVYAACQWGILIVLARLGGEETVGLFALALAITAPIITFSNLSLRQVQATDVNRSYSFSNYFMLRAATTLVALLGILAYFALLNYPDDIVNAVIAVALSKAFESMSDIYYGLEQRHQRLDLVACSLILRGTLGLAVLTTVYYFFRSLVLSITAMAMLWGVVWLCYDVHGSRLLRQRDCYENNIQQKNCQNHFKQLRQLALLALPVGLSAMLVSLNTNVPRYFIETYLGKADLGIFAAIAYLVLIGNMIINSMWQAASPRLAKYYFENNISAFLYLLSKLVLIGLTLGGIGILSALLFGREILLFLYGPAFIEDTDVFTYTMMAGTASYVAAYLGSALIPLRLFRSQLGVLITVVCVNILICYMLIPNYNLEGAVVAWIISLMVYITICSIIIYYKLFRSAALLNL